MQKYKLILFMSICVISLFGCRQINEEMTVIDDLKAVSISESKGYGGLNESYFMTLDEPETLSILEEMMKSAKGEEHDAGSLKPDYDLLIEYKNGDTHGLHLIMGNEDKESIFMYIGHEKNAFRVSTEFTKELEEFVNLHFPSR